MPRGSVYSKEQAVQRNAFSNARAQARHRGQEWSLDYEDWCAAWGSDFVNRGRKPGSKCLVRNDETKPWCKDNLLVVDRSEVLIHQKKPAPRPLYRE